MRFNNERTNIDTYADRPMYGAAGTAASGKTTISKYN